MIYPTFFESKSSQNLFGLEIEAMVLKNALIESFQASNSSSQETVSE